MSQKAERPTLQGHPKTLLLSFLLVSCLISINCASFERQLASSQQPWREPDYRFYSASQVEAEPERSEPSLDELVKRLTSSPEAQRYALRRSLADGDQQQSEGFYYGLPNNSPQEVAAIQSLLAPSLQGAAEQSSDTQTIRQQPEIGSEEKGLGKIAKQSVSDPPQPSFLGNHQDFGVSEHQANANLQPIPYTRHFQPGDQVYSSYRQGVYNMPRGPGDQATLSLVNKSNDVYFLAMVAAFCAMAMAVVLAAGLFAYRVQQNRKMSSETEYPTYGVVGPNNKCGAATFVGGYFAGNSIPGSNSPTGSKGQKTKTNEVFSNSDSGLTHSSSSKSGSSGKRALEAEQSSSQVGANRGADFMASNQNAARMYHYQHQKQQMIISDRGSNGRHTSASDLDSEEENDDGSYTVYECPGLASAHEMEIKNPLFNDDRTP